MRLPAPGFAVLPVCVAVRFAFFGFGCVTASVPLLLALPTVSKRSQASRNALAVLVGSPMPMTLLAASRSRRASPAKSLSPDAMQKQSILSVCSSSPAVNARSMSAALRPAFWPSCVGHSRASPPSFHFRLGPRPNPSRRTIRPYLLALPSISVRNAGSALSASMSSATRRSSAFSLVVMVPVCSRPRPFHPFPRSARLVRITLLRYLVLNSPIRCAKSIHLSTCSSISSRGRCTTMW